MRIVGGMQLARYLLTPEWREKREQRMELDSYRCFRCQSEDRLNVHHITYERLGRERMSDLVTLCWSCHRKEHGHDPSLPRAAPDSFYSNLSRRAAIRENWQEVVTKATIASAALDDLFGWMGDDPRVEEIRRSLCGMMDDLESSFMGKAAA